MARCTQVTFCEKKVISCLNHVLSKSRNNIRGKL
jgi:hypothetical protein